MVNTPIYTPKTKQHFILIYVPGVSYSCISKYCDKKDAMILVKLTINNNQQGSVFTILSEQAQAGECVTVITVL